MKYLGPMTNGMTGTISNDVYADSYVYLRDTSYGFGTATLIQGQRFDLSILGINDNTKYVTRQNAAITAWIDFNQDGIFDDTEQINLMKIPASSYTYGFGDLFYFTVPADAKLGFTRLRTRIMWGSKW